ncbi:hypothetical protein Are01nite_80250 [Actinoplanes regularis]|nr:hypothetical protein Are01nite_80250 [Actinoplanes regularis]
MRRDSKRSGAESAAGSARNNVSTRKPSCSGWVRPLVSMNGRITGSSSKSSDCRPTDVRGAPAYGKPAPEPHEESVMPPPPLRSGVGMT